MVYSMGMESTSTRHDIQARLEALLGKSGIPADSIHVYGSQIVVTARGQATARRWAALIATFAKVRGIVETSDYNAVNTNTVMLPSRHKVWRVYGRV